MKRRNNLHSPLRGRKSAMTIAIQRCFDGCAVLAAAGVLASNPALAQTSRIPVNALPNGPGIGGGIRQPQVLAGRFDPYVVSGNTATITQNDAAGILRWGSFDIGANAVVNIQQPSASAVLLNKVDGGAYLNKTVIEGMLKGNGQVYIYNPNGIIFGKTSQVDVNSLVATTLKIDDRRFMAGLLAPNVLPVFVADADATVTDANGVVSLVGTPGGITVEGGTDSQARLSAMQGGKVLLVAPSVVNNGQLSALDGQVVLAAGQSVYLASPSDIRMRGLLVEVNNDAVASNNGNPALPAAGSTATNDVLGKIKVGTGNATLVGLAVNQMGVVSATTSVNVNGSIYLHARDHATQGSITAPTAADHGGTLILGANSTTQILPTLDDATTTAGSSFNASQVDLSGKSIHMLNNARIVAPAGEVTARAFVDAKAQTSNPGSGASITLDAGAVIDVSGTTSTQLAMESNVINVDLRGTEFADVPLLRNSALRGKTVSVDARKGNLKIANIQGWLDLVQHGVGERTAVGGTVKLLADDAVILNSGARIDVSGGGVSYLPGYIATTQLTAYGRVYDISSATADRIYDGVVAAEAGTRNFEAGYWQGYSAGSIQVSASTVSLDATLRGTATPGPKQRDISSASRPLGGELVVGTPVDINLPTPDYFYQAPVTLGASSSGLALNPATLANEGFSRLSVYTGGAIDVASAVQWAPGGALTLASGDTVELGAGVRLPGGKLTTAAVSKVNVDPGVTLDVSGLWTNDRVLSQAEMDGQGNPINTVVSQGGNISLSAPTVVVGAGAHFDASGGAWLSSGNKLSAGSGGTISVTASTDPAVAHLALGDDVTFSAYGVNTGGKLTLSGRGVTIGGASTDPLDISLDTNFFQSGGFSAYDIRAAENIDVVAGANVAPRMDSWLANRTTAAKTSGSMLGVYDVGTLPLAGPLGSRGASSLSLSALPQAVDGLGRVNVAANASIVTDPGGTVSLSAGRQLTVDGTIRAPGGTINLALTPAINSAVPYRAERSIWVGSQAVLDAGGTAVRLWQDSTGLTRGNLLDGGSIKFGRFDNGNLVAAPGYVVVEQGAQLNVAGTTAVMTLPLGTRSGVTTRTVASAGGSIDIRAREGILVEGDLSAAGGNTSAAGGSLSLVLDRENISGPSDYPTVGRNLNVMAGSGSLPSLTQPDTALRGWEGQGYVLANSINQGGFDWVKLKSQNTLSFDLGAGSLALRARAGMTLDAPAFVAAPGAVANSVASVAAPYVQIGNSDWRYQSAPTAAASVVGGVALQVNADTVDLVGHSVLRGFDAATIASSGDIRLVGQVPIDLSVAASTSPPSLAASGSFTAAGTMTFTSAQLYPTTLSQFQLMATGSDGRIIFNGTYNPDSLLPLSAGGSLLVTARDIVQNGIVRAPLGKIDFEATDSLSYGAGSLTSVAGGTLIPFGFVQNGRDWLYDFGNGNTVDLNNTKATNYFALPEKSIVSRAASVTFNSGAVLDLSGSGDLYAYEFTPGPGGSRDVLAKVLGSAVATTFAILPSYRNTVAPRDFQYGQDGGLKAGDSVYLSGIDGLLPGYYTLLPAHYALMPGAYAISAAPAARDITAAETVANLDGSWLVAGYRSALGGSAENRWSGFVLTPTSLVRQQSAFADYSGNSFLTALASSPKDGGHVMFDVTHSLTLDGLVRLGAIGGGRNGIADISAPEIAIVVDRSSILPAESAPGALKLAVADLTALGADSLLIGAVREVTGDTDHLTVGTENVVVENDAAHPLTGPEVILAANDTVKLKSGSALSATGTLGRTPRTLAVTNGTAPTLGADGALLRLSSGSAVATQRNYIAADGTQSAPVGAKGTLDIEAGVTLAARGSVVLDATRSTSISGPLALGNGTALALGANRISLGDDAPANVSGLRFDAAGLTALDNLSALAFTSYSTIDVYGAVNLGSSATEMLSFAGGGIRGMSGANAADAHFTARTIRFDQAGTDAASGASGSLEFNARDIELGNGAFGLHGFALATLNATNEIRSVGQGGALSADGDLRLAAGRIAARGGTDADVTAGGNLTLTQGSGVVGTLPVLEFGGKLTFGGSNIVSDANIAALAGLVKLTASNGVNITGGTISAAGGAETFGSTTAYAGAGRIALSGRNVTVGSNATLDVSAVGADAGTISITAVDGGGTGTAVLNGSFKGGALAAADQVVPSQGSFVMDVDALDPAMGFGALNAKLNASGFVESRNFRVRNDDVTLLASDATVKAHKVVVAADNGNITIGGTIDASGSKGGSIELYAAEASAGLNSGNVNIHSGAMLNASATVAATSAAGSSGDGGRIVIGTSTADGSQPSTISGDASISVSAGAVLDVRAKADDKGNVYGQGGTVLLRAPRLSTDDDVAIATLDTSVIKGSRSTAIEAYKVYFADTISANADSGSNLKVADANGNGAGLMFSNATSFITNNGSAIASRLNLDSSVALAPGMEVRSTGATSDLTVSVNESLASSKKQNRGWNLDTWRFNGQPGVLTLRAGGNLIVNGSISDGFTKSATAAMPDWVLDTSASGNSSWSYRLVGGADQAAANPLATSFGTGDVKVSFVRTSGSSTDLPVALVRTGTGFIDVAAGHDVLLDTLDLSKQTVLGGSFISSANFSADTLLGASLYTAGHGTALPAGYSAPTIKNNAAYGSTTSTAANFTSDGGSISIDAGHDVVGPVTDQMINNWLFRQGRSYETASGAIVFDVKNSKVQNTAWWSRFDYFDQGIAAFGGGDISVVAETGNVTNVSVSIPTNAYVTGTSPVGVLPVEQGGGDLSVRAGGDIRGGSFYVQKGNAVLSAGGSVTAGDHLVEDLSVVGNSSNGGVVTALRTVLVAGDTQFRVIAGKDLEIEGVFNPTMTEQSTNNVVGSSSSPFSAAPATLPDKFGNYSSYSASASVSLTSVSGDLLLSENANALHLAGGNEILSHGDFLGFYLMQPGTLHAVALGGDLRFEHGFSMAPSASGQLDLLAKGSVLAEFHRDANGDPAGQSQPIVMIDRDPATMPNVLSPTMLEDSIVSALMGSTNGLSLHTAGGLHANDSNPVRIIALNGDVDFRGDSYFPATVVLPKRAEISAGRDILDLGFSIQQLSATDATTVTAGRDFVVSTKVTGGNNIGQLVSGPGQVDFQAGRNFDLGNSAGIVTRGNLDNPYLPAQGASIDLVAGATPDYGHFFSQFPLVTDLPLSKQSELVAYMRQLQPGLPVTTTPAVAWSLFAALPLSERRQFLNSLFFDALARTTGAIGGGVLDLAAFDATIASLFPAGSIGGGDINVFGSQMKTMKGGAITIYAPGGSVYAGLTTIPAYLKTKKASDLGLFTVGGGALQSLVKNDFLVNQGRVFTLGGGDITLVSQYQNIDAGKGAKTAQSTPPPLLTTDEKGNTQVDISGSIAGSGIQTLRTSADVPASDVNLIAPRGVVDAGDAGISAGGDINVIAQKVLNGDNFSAGGGVSGVKTADTSGLGGAVAAPTTAPVAKSDGFSNGSNTDPNAATNLTVELMGYGEGNAIPSDGGQQNVTQDSQTPSPADATDVRKKKSN